jgi:hypothetical protein
MKLWPLHCVKHSKLPRSRDLSPDPACVFTPRWKDGVLGGERESNEIQDHVDMIIV